MKKRIAAASVALAALAVPAVAGAAPEPFTGGDVWVGDADCVTGTCTVWDLYPNGDIGHSYVYVDGVEFGNVICGESGRLELDGSGISTNDDFLLDTDANGDRVVTGTGTFGTLDAAVEYRAYAEGDLLRLVYVVTNNTGAAVTVTPSIREDPADSYIGSETEGYGTGLTTDGDDLVETSDRWYSIAEPIEPGGIYGRYWGSQDDITVVDTGSFDLLGNSDDVTFGDVTIPAGASYQWIFFHQYLPWSYDGAASDDANALAQASVATTVAGDFGANLTLTGRLARDLDGTIPNNWGYTSENLPTTGSDSTGLVLAGLTLALMGGAVLVRRRATV